MTHLWQKALDLLEVGQPCVMVQVIKAEGSTPREEGAQMLVTGFGIHGSIGGGTLEWHAMAEAQALIGKPASKTITKSLGPDLGQCCGGRMTLYLESFTQVDVSKVKSHALEVSPEDMQVHLWGAGHVGRALVFALAPLPFKVSWWDVRESAFPRFTPENVTCRLGRPRDMDQPGIILVMTHSHALDLEIVDFALRQPQFANIGLIGSETKKARFIKRLKEAGHTEGALSRFTCPVGSKAITSKLPAVIAATIAVQLLQWQEMLKTRGISVLGQRQSAKS